MVLTCNAIIIDYSSTNNKQNKPTAKQQYAAVNNNYVISNVQYHPTMIATYCNILRHTASDYNHLSEGYFMLHGGTQHHAVFQIRKEMGLQNKECQNLWMEYVRMFFCKMMRRL